MLLVLLALAVPLAAADYSAPAGTRHAARRPGAESVLPGGRLITPLGRQYPTGPGPFGLAVSPGGNLVVSADGGPNRYSLTVVRRRGRYRHTRHIVAPRKKQGAPKEPEENEWRSIFQGLAFQKDRTLYASEGNSGRVRAIDPASGDWKRSYELDGNGFTDSYTGDLAIDRERGLLYVLDQANFRLAVVDLDKHSVVASIRVGRLPFSIALSGDARHAYVANLGMFEYKPVPGADARRARETGLDFPAFGFPSPEAAAGARRETAQGPVNVPGLGDPNVPESNSLAIVDVSNPAAPRVERFVRTGLPFGPRSLGGSSPSGVVAAGDAVFVSNAHNDSITVVDARTGEVRATIEIRIPGLESFRGVLPLGLAYDAAAGRVYVAEAGINAVGMIDARTLRLLGHVPAGWFPTRVAVDRGTVYVANAKGHGTGPNAERSAAQGTFQGEFRRGSISIFPAPADGDLDELTRRVLANNGFLPSRQKPAALPAAIRHVILIVKENRTFDEVFGDVASAANGPVAGLPPLARFGRNSRLTAGTRALRFRTEPKDAIDAAPNHHELARRFAFSDNFYADSEVSVDGHHWIVGSYPNAWTESSLMAAYGGEKDFRLNTAAPGRLQFPQSNSSLHPEEQLEAGAIWHHLDRHGITFRNYGEGFELAGVDEGAGLKPTGARYLTNVPMPDPLWRNTSREYPQFNMNIPDQYRASQFIAEVERKYRQGGEAFPRFVFIHLPNDHLAKPRPEDGYPYEASYMADNDYALGRIIEFLSGSPWWREMAIFITEDDAQGWVDHVDSHRTVLLVVSPYARKNYASHVNASFPGLLKTAFRLLAIPPLNLFDAAASDLADCFTSEPDFTPYKVLPVDARVFEPDKARDPLDPQPSPRMDDPAVLREQHRQYR